MQSTFELSRRLYPPAPADATVDFGNPTLFAGMARISEDVLENKLARPEFVFFKRAELGLYNVLHQLGARISTRGLLDRSLERHPES